jgi:hypothetical protein
MASLERIRQNPSLYPGALDEDEMAAFPWHDHADSAHSSQVFCVSAFGAVRQLRCRDRIIAGLVTPVFPAIRTAARPRRWEIRLEYQQPELLGELGSNQPTSIDALLLSSSEVICVEAKFLSDARSGFGACSQGPSRCKGFFGPGSDVAGTGAWCRLESWDGRRSPRLYWAFGKEFFRPEVFQRQCEAQQCPFAGSNYQLMRNFLFAASYAKVNHLPSFGVLVISPARTQDVLLDQLCRFQTEVLRPDHRDRMVHTTYEAYIGSLNASQDQQAKQLAAFLEARLTTLIR